ncbi:MAG: tRNA (adenosine(37)-N6)-threonylcarbamoyltransferase complex dimerization subunit type 1 TsaB [Chromatiales bacterium]|jgi:tRNA threonylcarbamoyladenosine biosynthesis protein TsaB
MKLLALDTATEACSAALLIDGEMLERFEVQPRKHAELILPMLDSLLAEAQLSLSQIDAIAFGRGPGAFTGVRIATGVVQGIAYAADLPVAPVSTLQALAQRAFADFAAERVLAAFDARMEEVYWAAYELDGQQLMRLRDEELVIRPQQLQLQYEGDWLAAGSGWQTYQQQLSDSLQTTVSRIEAGLITRAREVALLGADLYQSDQLVSAEQALPVYLRNQVAWKKSG